MIGLLRALLFTVTAHCTAPPFLQNLADPLPDNFDWNSLIPNQSLNYTDCYEGLQCSRVSVHLDWQGSQAGKFISLAVARLPAKVSQSDPAFGGTIVINPGGPGGSGVDLLRWSGKGIQEIVDGEKHFEILSFDPRGVKHSTPTVACFKDDHVRELFNLAQGSAGSVTDSDAALNAKWALAEGLGKLCADTDHGVWPDGTDIRQYVSTLQVAYDMLNLTEVIDKERHQAIAEDDTQSAVQHALWSETRPLPLLNYWGYSYGSYLGNTFASMFPERIGRMIVDGVVDAPDYLATSWRSNLQDNNALWVTFSQWCFEAGPACALFDSSMKDWNHVGSKLNVYIDHLRANPLSVVSNDGIHILRYFDLESQMHDASYGPWQTWPLLAKRLAALIDGDVQAYIGLLQPATVASSTSSHEGTSSQGFNLLDPLNNRTMPYPPGYPHQNEASISIRCGDGDDITSDDKEDYGFYLDDLMSQSQLIGPIWAEITMYCRRWPKSLRPSDINRFTGPFGSTAAQRSGGYIKDGTGKLLFIGNTADPVTPGRNARKMAEAHKGEGVGLLIQDAPGHCSGVNIPSTCTWNVIKDFFNHGELPEKGKRCEVDFKPWDRL